MTNEELNELLKSCNNKAVHDSYLKTKPKCETKRKIVVSVSGGADSDILVDIFAKLGKGNVDYVFFDTGIEYQATKKHLTYLEQHYGIDIKRQKAIVPVPLGCIKYGVPFWSKFASEMIERLQRHNFKWEDRPFEELIKEYPKCQSALMWWCNHNEEKQDKQGKAYCKFNISHTPYLKEFMVENPPTFKISNKCCKGAKKDNIKIFLTENNADLSVVGIRKDEGGIRATAYKSCFNTAKDDESWDSYRPIFWYNKDDREYYEKYFGVKHSDCYCKYGLKSTGCAGCPFGEDFENELRIIEIYEPQLYKAVNNIFGKSYDYTRKYLAYREQKQREKKGVDK